MESNRITSSFRDPSGFVYADGDNIRRVINPIYFKQYDVLTKSGLFADLFAKKYLIPHTEISRDESQIQLEAEKIPFISYPYEWSFLQYKHAALLTLKLQKFCLKHNFTLKDASAFNITFHNGKPIFIDTLSFDFYEENAPWKAYKQFIMHFLGPLVLTKYYGHDFLKTLASEIDGIPLKKLSKLLPAKTYLNPTLFTNVHLLAKYDHKYSQSQKVTTKNISKSAQLTLLDSLYNYIKDLKVNSATEWDDYYNQLNYNDQAYRVKKEYVKNWFVGIAGTSVIDIGGNDGTFARELDGANFIVAADIDPNAVEQNYRKIIANSERHILPLVADVLNPAAGYGFNNAERFSLIDRVSKQHFSGCLALAVIHHITLSGNIPFNMSAQFFAKMAPNLLIEFPARDDSWVQFLLDSKRDARSHFDFYNETAFEQAYSEYFTIESKFPIEGSARILYAMKVRNG